jgi:hypothetical protein
VTWPPASPGPWTNPKTRGRNFTSEQGAALPDTLTVRLLRFKIPTAASRCQEVIRVTTLLDRQLWPLQLLAQWYARRWKVELHLDDLKTTLGMDQLSCLSPQMVEKELQMHTIAYNLIRSLMAEAASTCAVPLDRLSFKGTLDTAREYSRIIVRLPQSHRHMRQRIYADLLAAIAADPVPERPNRYEPRSQIYRRKAFPNLVRPRAILRQEFFKRSTPRKTIQRHPETLGGANSLLTSDFSGYWRDAVENGVPEPNAVKGLGGMCIYFQGLVGGLMTQLHTTVPHRNGVDKFREPSFEKAQALGENLAILTVNALRGEKAWRPTDTRVAVAAKTIFAPMSGLSGCGVFLGLVHPGWYWGKGKTELDVIQIGDLEMLTIPGEMYPEIAEGGIESPAGADYPSPPIEVPPLRSQMKGKLNMMVGLANDELGYIIPKSQWDKKPPYAYGRTKAPQYGEENSPGPDVAPTIHREALALLKQFQAAQ